MMIMCQGLLTKNAGLREHKQTSPPVCSRPQALKGTIGVEDVEHLDSLRLVYGQVEACALFVVVCVSKGDKRE